MEVMNNVLSVAENIFMDDSITKLEYHSRTPYSNSTFSNNDEIRIPIQNQEIYTLPSQSHLYIQGKLVTSENKYRTTLRLINNGIAFLFDEIRYELRGYIIDRNRNVGMTSLMKTLISYSPNEMTSWKNACWELEGTPLIMGDKGHFSVYLPSQITIGIL